MGLTEMAKEEEEEEDDDDDDLRVDDSPAVCSIWQSSRVFPGYVRCLPRRREESRFPS